jgi:hypothetical protein
VRWRLTVTPRIGGALWVLLGLVAAIVLCLSVASAAAKPSPKPTPTPTPGIYNAPANIKSNCSAAVEGKLMAWLATVPDGSTVQFAANGCYGQDGTITLAGRKHLVLDGRGAEFRALTPGDSHRANWRFVNGSDLTVRNMAVRGSNAQDSYDPTVEWQHGYSIEGVQGMNLLNVQARETWGDGIDLWRGAYSPACGDDASSARNVVITGATLERNGRQGLAVVDAERVTLQSSRVGPVAWSSVDLETDDDCEIARHITIANNSFGANRYGVVASVGFGGDPQVGDVTVTDNVQTAPTGLPATGECWAPVRILSPDGLYRNGYTFSGNHFLARRNGFEFRRVRDIAVDSNTIDYDTTFGCGTRAGALLVDAHTVGIINNLFNGADRVFTADAASTDIASQGNTTSDGTATAAPTGPPSTATQTSDAAVTPPSGDGQTSSPTDDGSTSPPASTPTVAPGSGGGGQTSPPTRAPVSSADNGSTAGEHGPAHRPAPPEPTT